MPLLDVHNLSISFDTSEGRRRAVQDLSFSLDQGEIIAIVGESGCGKSVTSLSILGLIEQPPGVVVGSIHFQDRNLLQMAETDLMNIRGNEIGMIFQEPMTSLNPTLSVGFQISETLRRHRRMSRRQAAIRAMDLLVKVGIPDPERRIAEYPHQLSGGMRQRMMIAMAIACTPKILIADEPTTALDVTIQAQVLSLLRELRDESGLGMLLITHDFGVVNEMADRIVVMYAGRKVEEGNSADIFRSPRHPYTVGLLGCLPRLGTPVLGGKDRRLNEIPGSIPDLRQPINGCSFAPRCPRALDVCTRSLPTLESLGPDHLAACHNPQDSGMTN